MRRRRVLSKLSGPVAEFESRLCPSATAFGVAAQAKGDGVAPHKVKPQAEPADIAGEWNWEWDGGGDGTLTLTPNGNKLQVSFSRPTLIMGTGPAKVHGDKVKMKIAGTQAYPFKATLTMSLSDADHMTGKFKLTYTEKVSREDSFSIGISAVHVHI